MEHRKANISHHFFTEPVKFKSSDKYGSIHYFGAVGKIYFGNSCKQSFSSKEFIKFSAKTMNKYLLLNFFINPFASGLFSVKIQKKFLAITNFSVNDTMSGQPNKRLIH